MEPLLAPYSAPVVRFATAQTSPASPGTEEISLSRYFPKGTEYFYGYPSGEDSGFFHAGSPAREELIAARAVSCAGPAVRTITFAATADRAVQHILRNEIGCVFPAQENAMTLPAEINLGLAGSVRNARIKIALSQMVRERRFAMAQPYVDEKLAERYVLDPQLTLWLNDKKNMPDYIPSVFLPRRFGVFADGASFADASLSSIPVPCVVKISSSCAGDGVRICQTRLDLLKAQTEHARVRGSILVEEHVKPVRNFGIQFGIPADPRRKIELIGVSEQLTTPEGAFIGGLVDPERIFARIDGINALLLHNILPDIRDRGWFGVGGFDVLVDQQERFFIVDPNFRMTGMTAFLFAARNNRIRKCMASFTGTFRGSDEQFLRTVAPLAREGSPHQRLHILALTHHNDVFRMSAALLFEREEEHDVPRLAGELLVQGIASPALEKLQRNGREHYPNLPENGE